MFFRQAKKFCDLNYKTQTVAKTVCVLGYSSKEKAVFSDPKLYS
ncbi:hypothetical protein SGRA_0645 [Saprospira grandis str. Lewin]|uniref:Uncharacterized protein n=1 Tax=Saprospira grandis (strain Lewin) TaxID=984262 RepID=H6L0F4_SAPGL|nr:hypothetical protein SGRA_0645 [Saprospira grandis str. Lewin]